MLKKEIRRQKIKTRVRAKISGTAERPRLTVFRSNKQIYAQVIDDDDSCEGEGTTTLGNLSYTVDGHEALYELILLLGISVCLCAII